MTELNMLRTRVILRNVLAFAAMVAVCGAALEIVLQALAFFEIGGIHRLTIPFAVDALCGVLGYFAFAGDARLRTVLVFFSVIALGGVAVVFYDPGKTFYPLLTSVPFAAVAAAIASATGRYMENRGSRHAPKASG
jgi:peptidoglycan/LPS O-acetylase OafA/YrhL